MGHTVLDVNKKIKWQSIDYAATATKFDGTGRLPRAYCRAKGIEKHQEALKKFLDGKYIPKSEPAENSVYLILARTLAADGLLIMKEK